MDVLALASIIVLHALMSLKIAFVLLEITWSMKFSALFHSGGLMRQ